VPSLCGVERERANEEAAERPRQIEGRPRKSRNRCGQAQIDMCEANAKVGEREAGVAGAGRLVGRVEIGLGEFYRGVDGLRVDVSKRAGVIGDHEILIGSVEVDAVKLEVGLTQKRPTTARLNPGAPRPRLRAPGLLRRREGPGG
jgi:hypothetical protein